jgi:5'-AMP-activated protein kinase regulatory gamma subunit
VHLQRSIRDFLKKRTSYDVLPLSFRLIILNTDLLVKKSLNILMQNGLTPFLHLSVDILKSSRSADPAIGIVSAPLWDSHTSTFAGILTTSDYINVVQYYWQNPDAFSQVDQFRLSSLRGESIPIARPIQQS